MKVGNGHTRNIRARNYARVIALTAVLLTQCAKDVSITIVAPATFADGVVTVDGRQVARLEEYSADEPKAHSELEKRGSIARFEMDLGEHAITLRPRVGAPVDFRLNYARRTEDYIVIDSSVVEKLRKIRGVRPLLHEVE